MLLISFAFILLFQFIPAPAGLNQTSMQVIGIFIGIMLMWNFIGTDWPSLLCMAILAIFQIMSPGDIFKSGFGNSTIAFLLVFFMLSHVLSQVGLTRRLAIWFFTNKLAQRSPWMFVTMFLFGAMFMASFMSQTAALLVFLPIAEQVFKELKYEKGDRFPQMLVLGLGIAVGIGSANTPLGHAIILIPIQLLESQTGLSVNIMAYSAFGIVTGLLIFAALILVYRLLYRPDLNKLRHYDATRLRSDLQPMSVQEKISAVLFVVVIVIWLLQGFLKDIAPTVGGYISALGNAVPVMVAIVILCLTKVDGKPIMDYKDAAARGVPWSALIFNAAVLVISGALTLEKVGISDFLISNVTPPGLRDEPDHLHPGHRHPVHHRNQLLLQHRVRHRVLYHLRPHRPGYGQHQYGSPGLRHRSRGLLRLRHSPQHHAHGRGGRHRLGGREGYVQVRRPDGPAEHRDPGLCGLPHRRRGAVSVRPTVDAGMKSPVRSAQRQTPRGLSGYRKKATPDFES